MGLGLLHRRKSGMVIKRFKSYMNPKSQAKKDLLITYAKKYRPHLLHEKNKLKEYYDSEYSKEAA